MGLHAIDLYPGFTLFGGEWTDCYIYSLDPKDAPLAWAAAQARAQEAREQAGLLAVG